MLKFIKIIILFVVFALGLMQSLNDPYATIAFLCLFVFILYAICKDFY